MSQSSYFPLFRSRKIFEWNFVIVFISCSGAFWAVYVFLRRDTPSFDKKRKTNDLMLWSLLSLDSVLSLTISYEYYTTIVRRLYPPFAWSWIRHVRPFLKKEKKAGEHDRLLCYGASDPWFSVRLSTTCVPVFFSIWKFLAVKFTFFRLLKKQLTTFNLNSRL